MKTYKLPVTIVLQITEEDIEDIVDMGLTYGISDWCGEQVYTDDLCCKTDGKYLMDGGSILLYDKEDNSEYELDFDKLLKGIGEWITKGYDRYNALQSDGTLDTGEIDSEMANIIIQFALFNDIVYG